MYVIIIRYGNDSSKRICKVLRRLKVKHKIVDCDKDMTIWSTEENKCVTHIILSGGPDHVYASKYRKLPLWVINSNIPVLGICYGMQLIAHTFGGFVIPMSMAEQGLIPVIDNHGIITNRWMNRLDRVMYVPDKFIITETTTRGHIAAFTDNIKWWAVQYHPEVKKALDENLFIEFLRK